MKFFLTVILVSAILLSLSKFNLGPKQGNLGIYSKSTPTNSWIYHLKSDVIDSFKDRRNALAFWAFLSGGKEGISPKLKKEFVQLELGFLISPSGLHLSSFMLIWLLVLKKICSKKIFRRLKILITLGSFFLPVYTLKRLAIFKVLILIKNNFKKKWRIEVLFFLTFLISFLLGHYQNSPQGFILSFLFLGTTLALRDYSRLIFVLGLFIAHLTFNFFQGGDVSLVALLLAIPLIFYFTLMMSLSSFYLLTFKILNWNWMESILSIFFWLLKKCALLSRGTHIDSSFILICGLLCFLMNKNKRVLLFALLLHTNLALSPLILISGPRSKPLSFTVY